MLHSPKNTDILSNGHVNVTSNNTEDEKKNWRASVKASLMKATNLTRSGSVKTLIHKFSVSESSEQITPNISPSSQQGKDGTGNATESRIPTVTVTSPSGESKNGPITHSHSGRVSVCAVCHTRPDDLCYATRKNRITSHFESHAWIVTLVISVICVCMRLLCLSPHH